MKDTSQTQTLKDRFDADKQTTLASAEQYLKDNKTKPLPFTPTDLRNQREDITKLVGEGKFEQALIGLEKLRDAKSGIVQVPIANTQGTPTLIRDARAAKTPPVKETESFEMQYLNAIRAGMDLADGKPEVQAALLEKAKKFFASDGFHTKTDLSQKQLGKEELKKEIKDIGVLLGENGISEAYTKLNIAKDFQNFKDKHSNIVTVSSIEHGGKSHTVIEAEVALKGLTARQKEEYAAISIKSSAVPKPAWYTAMPAWEQELCKKYAPTIAAGNHVLPTQLRQMVGMKNAFEKTTAYYNPEKSELEVLHTSKHSGTLASLSRDKSERQRITDENAKQAQEWIGSERKLHMNTLNSGPIGAGDDPEIVRSTQQAMKNVGGAISNTAFNAFRRLGGANDFSGVKDSLKDISDSLPDDAAFKGLKNHLQPKGFFGRLFRTGDPQFEIDTLRASGKIDDKTKEILENAIDLRRTVEKADKIIRFRDSENLSLQVSTKLGNLADNISNAIKKEELRGFDKGKLSLMEVIKSCASGKDRTGLAEHDGSAQAIANRIGATAKDIDAQLLKGGHTAQQAGGIHAGGATIGCYGTKSENRAGLPKSRKKDLEGIIEVSANSNKIKGNSKKIDKEVEKQIAKEGGKPLQAQDKKATFKGSVEIIEDKAKPKVDKQQSARFAKDTTVRIGTRSSVGLKTQEAAKAIGQEIPPKVKTSSPEKNEKAPRSQTVNPQRRNSSPPQIGK